MRDTFELNPDILAELRAPRPYPAVSLLLPTHPASPDGAEDAIRLRNLVSEAKKRLADDPGVDKTALQAVEARIDEAAASVDSSEVTDGTLLLASANDWEVWKLPVTPPERVVVADTYLTRNLVSSWLHERPYWVLVLSEEGSRLWHGAGESLTEVTGFGFPAKPELPDHEDAEPGANFGLQPSPYREERLRQYLRDVDDKLAEALRTGKGPVHVVGTANQINTLVERSRSKERVGERVERAGADKLTGHVLLDVIRPAREKYTAERQRDALDRLGEGIGQKRFAAGTDEIWQNVQEGRVHLLLVEDGFQVSAIPEATHLRPAASPEDPDVEDDIVDTLVETALGTGADVVFVPDDALAEHGRVAAVLRY
ncbi:baeRF3 domain-containing protein [Streptomyces sp. DT18]